MELSYNFLSVAATIFQSTSFSHYFKEIGENPNSKLFLLNFKLDKIFNRVSDRFSLEGQEVYLGCNRDKKSFRHMKYT